MPDLGGHETLGRYVHNLRYLLRPPILKAGFREMLPLWDCGAAKNSLPTASVALPLGLQLSIVLGSICVDKIFLQCSRLRVPQDTLNGLVRARELLTQKRMQLFPRLRVNKACIHLVIEKGFRPVALRKLIREKLEEHGMNREGTGASEACGAAVAAGGEGPPGERPGWQPP